MRILKLFRNLLGVLLLILVVVFIFLDVIVKRLIEQEGTKVVKAKVELNEVALHYSPLGLTLRGLKVTNPQSPMTNAFEVQVINVGVAFTPLLKQKIIIEEAALEGMKFNTLRKVSGAVAGLTPTKQASSWSKKLDQNISLPAVNLPDPKVMIESADLETLKRVSALEKRIQAKQQAWEQRVASLPNEQTLKDYQQRIAKLQNIQNPLKRIQALKEVIDIQKDVKQDFNTIRQTQTDLKRDIAAIQSEINQVKAATKQDVARMINSVGLDTQSLQALAPLIFGQQVLGWVDQGHQLYRQLLPYLETTTGNTEVAATQPEAPPEMDTTDYTDGLPKFLIKKLSLSGLLPIPTDPVSFQGKMTDITHQPSVWGKPITVNLTSQVQNRKLLAMKAVLDHIIPKNAADHIEFKIQQWPLEGIVLSADKRFPVTLVASQMSSLTNVLIKKGEIRLSSNVFFDRVQLQQPGFDSKGLVQQALMQVVSDIKHFEVSVSANGTLVQPNLKVKTSLDSVMQQSAKAIMQKEQKKLASKLQQEMDVLLSKQLAQLNTKMQGFGNIEKILGSKINRLSGLL
jgi:uncharacterized protein (TIGR03545 family)